MKKLIALVWLMGSLLPLSGQQKTLSTYNIRHEWSNKEYKVCQPGGTPTVESCVLAFAGKFKGYPMLDALSACISGGEAAAADFQLDRENDYVMIRLDNEELAETEARLWTLPEGKQLFVIKFVDHADATSEQICFCQVDAAQGVMSRIPSPEGFRYGYIDNILLSPTGREIEVKWQYRPSDTMVLQDDGSFVYQEFAPNAIGCYVMDSDPITNVRATPGGKIIARLGEQKESRSDEEDDWEEDMGVYTLTIYNPQNGWWQILGYYVGGVKIEDQAWIHYSVLGMHTRNYGGQKLKLYASPSEDAKVVATIKEAAADVRPMDVNEDGSWVKVKSKAGTGWIQREWLCDNPLTNCS